MEHIAPKISKILSILILFCCNVTLITSSTFALSESRRTMFAENNILFYDPDGSLVDCGSGDLTEAIAAAGSGYDRLKSVVATYGETAMQMQEKYGTPWEVIFAQMQIESQVGTTGVSVHGATNNWLGITGSGDAGSWTSSSGRKWAKFSSVGASIEAWAGPKVLRNGYYDDAFPQLNPNNYNLEAFLKIMISHYAPNSDGNNEAQYVKNILSIINGPIAAVRAEKNWPSSAELAKQKNIQVGGQMPIGGSIADGDFDDTVVANCVDPTGGNGDINATALALSWPDRSHDSDSPKPEYASALVSTGVSNLGDSCSKIGKSCDAFVATVMRHSGADPDFYCCGAASVHSYLINSNKYIEIPNTGKESDLRPGDILSSPSHVEIYVVTANGEGRIASASHCDRTGDHGKAYSSSYDGKNFRIFRIKG